MKYFEFDNHKIAYRESGSAGNPVLLFLHGNSLSSRNWKKQLDDPLLSSRFHCLAPDLPGHGESARDVSLYSMETMNKIIAAFLNDFGSDQVIAIGHSLGGHLLLESIDHMDNLKGLMIFGTPPLSFPPDPSAAFLPHPITQYLFSEQLSDLQFQEIAGTFISSQPVPEEVIQDLKKADGLFRAALGASLMMGYLKDETNIVDGLNIPLAVLHGGEDKLVNLDYIKNLSIPTLWRDEIRILNNSGHSPHLENPDAFNHQVLEFASDVF